MSPQSPSPDSVKEVLERLQDQNIDPDSPLIQELTKGEEFRYFSPALAPGQEKKMAEAERVGFFGIWLFHELSGEFPNGVETLADLRPGSYSPELSAVLADALACPPRVHSLEELRESLEGLSFEAMEAEARQPGQVQAGWLYRFLAALIDGLWIFLTASLFELGLESMLGVFLLLECLLIPLCQSSPGLTALGLEWIGGEKSVSRARLLGRGLVKIVSLLLLGIGYGWPLLRGGKRPWHEALFDLKLVHRA